MSKYTILIVLGIWIIILPFLGFPGFWKTLLFVVSGLGVVIFTLLVRSESSNGNPFRFGENSTDVYIDNRYEKKKEK